MLEPREADLPILFLVLVVLPVVTYILLGKWSESSTKKDRINLLAQLAAEEALRAEAMAAAAVALPTPVPLVASPYPSSSSPISKNGFHECARCFSPATTRCSRCKSIRYCSGKCQIIHWRQVHKDECRPLDNMSANSEDSMDAQLFGYYGNEFLMDKDQLPQDIPWYPSMNSGASEISQVPSLERKVKEKRFSHREISRKEDGLVSDVSEEAYGTEVPIKQKMRSKNANSPGEEVRKSKVRQHSGVHSNGNAASTSAVHENQSCDSHLENSFDQRNNERHQFPYSENESHPRLNPPYSIPDRGNTSEVGVSSNSWANVQAKNGPHPFGSRSSKTPRSSVEVSQEHGCLEADRKEQNSDGSNGVANNGIIKMVGMKKPVKVARHDGGELNGETHKKSNKMLFPYEEFVKFFLYDVLDLSPRGLINCGNSCYANAVLQCMTCTKPLTIYLLHRSHSRACCAKDWCLMCELEQHVTMLREHGAPLSPSRILSHMRTMNRQIGDGSQEDAHEFLRILIASMQSVCLEGLGGEKRVDPRLQETTFIQHTFGGRLRSKVKCLRCHHESERYENIMDLTLEIYGWVESLEDALTQFTNPEDLDGENMYRCGRCAAYVRARKQLSIHEAPNILTIVLKRFQGGRYGKINKFITFPEMLDMVPYMTGTDNIPPLYMLYAVVVHLDTLNASFSGHYVSYVRNLHGSWYRIDDTEVQPVMMSQVMSEGAYILFYMRSSPRPHRAYHGKAMKEPSQVSPKLCTSKTQKASRPEHSKSTSRPSSNGILHMSTSNTHFQPVIETNNYIEKLGFSDATSSDWSLFTSSDDASFTTESTRDSFSTVDYAENGDLISSIFHNTYGPQGSRNPISCRLLSNGGTQTRFASQEKGYVLDSYLSAQQQDSIRRGEKSKHVRGADRTSSNCKS